MSKRTSSFSCLAQRCAFSLATSAALLACGAHEPVAVAPPPVATAVAAAPPPAAPKPYSAVDREAFNHAAVRENLPVYWVSDLDHDGVVAPSEIETLLFYGVAPTWVADGKFTPDFDAAYARIARNAATAAAPPADERKKLVRIDLDTTMPTLVRTDFRAASKDEKAFVAQMIVVAHAVDVLFAKQTGADVVAASVPADDAESQSLFRRNWGPRCLTPTVDKNDACRATPELVRELPDVYPPSLQKEANFCAKIEKSPNAKALLEPFVTVRENAGKLEAVPYPKAYEREMATVAKELRTAAALVTSQDEAPLRAYLEAAAKSFATNDWHPADEAWAKMNATNSKFYVRVAPDETYWEPCSHKAGFHLDFALINRDSLLWQKKLDPLKMDMEKELAKLAGAPYKARNVSFHLPDFIDVIVNSGDSRDAIGATIGQSLPNWGVVAAEGRGRTVAMSNLYTDADNLAVKEKKARSLFVKSIADAGAWNETGPDLLTTVLHEAAHNLGPAHEYKVAGKTDETAFGGGLASMLEELKAQSAALYYVDWLKNRGVIDADLAKKTYLESILWAFGHIARGMYTETGQRKAYSQLAAIQIGYLIDAKAIVFDANATPTEGAEKGAFDVKLEALPAAVEALMKTVAGIKARGDRAAAEALAKRYVDGTTVPQKLIAERVLRYPQVSFVYAVDN